LALASALPSIDPAFRLQAFGVECVLRENDLAIMPMTTSKVPTATLRLLVIACIMVVAVRVTEAARELDNGVGGILLNREQLASVDTKAALTLFQAAACKLLRLSCAIQFSSDDGCAANGQPCMRVEDCCSGICIVHPISPPVPGRCVGR